MGIDYKSLILEEEVPEETEEVVDVVNGEEIVIPKVKKVYTKPAVEYIIDGISGPDMVMTRKTKTSEKQLVMLQSRNQIYVKNMKNGEIKSKDADELVRFFKDIPESYTSTENLVDGEGHKLLWLRNLPKNREQCMTLINVINDTGLNWFVNNDLVSYKIVYPCPRMASTSFNVSENSTVKNLTNQQKNLLKFVRELSGDYDERYKDMGAHMVDQLKYSIAHKIGGFYRSPIAPCSGDFIRDYWATNIERKATEIVGDTFKSECKEGDSPYYPNYVRNNNPTWVEITKRYGYDNTKRFIERFFESNAYILPNTNTINSILENNLDFNSMCEYMFDEAERQGYLIGHNLQDMCRTWADTLEMEKQIYGKIEDKYPKQLETLHKILAYKKSIIQDTIDAQKWDERAEKAAKFEYKGREYAILAPKTKNDVIDEAQQQSNCVASYVKKIINGDCFIFFCRRVKNLEKSLLTVEVRGDNTLGQVYRSHNRQPLPEEKAFVERWFEEVYKKNCEPLTQKI